MFCRSEFLSQQGQPLQPWHDICHTHSLSLSLWGIVTDWRVYRRILYLLIVTMLGMILSTASSLSLGRDTTRVGVLLVQFADYQVNRDARACFGYSAPSGADTIENKYRFGDYWNIFFQASGPVPHPDGDFPDNWARGQRQSERNIRTGKVVIAR